MNCSPRRLPGADVSDDIKSYDLVWLEHLVGDVHQPLHATSRFSADLPMGDRGGNSVALCAKSLQGRVACLLGQCARHQQKSGHRHNRGGQVGRAACRAAAIADDQSWITESFEAAKQFVYAAPVGPGAGPYTLNAAYKSQAKTEAKERIELAGIRLANLINANLK